MGDLPRVPPSMGRFLPVAQSAPPRTGPVGAVPCASPERNIPALIIPWRAAAKLPLGHFILLFAREQPSRSSALSPQPLMSIHTLFLGQVELFSTMYSQATSK